MQAADEAPEERRNHAAAERPPFSPGWVRLLEPLVLGARVRDGSIAARTVPFRCRDGDQHRAWSVSVDDGVISGVRCDGDDAPEVVTHSVTVGWRLLDLSVRGYHRLDELTVEQRRDGGCVVHPMPPLDEGPLDLRLRASSATVLWHERVLDSPLGTLFVTRGLASSRLRLVGASTKPPTDVDGVGSDVAWREMLACRHPASVDDLSTRRAWRGNEYEVRLIRTALLRGRHRPEVSMERMARDRVLLDALTVLRAMRRVLRGNPAWRDLWRPSATPQPDR